MNKSTTAPTHLGGMVLLKPRNDALDNIYQETKIIRSDEYKIFTKKMMVYGITFVANDNVTDDFMLKVAVTLKEMFPRKEGMDLELQEQVLQNVYKYRGVIPFIRVDEVDEIEKQLECDDFVKKNSVPDIIIEGSKTQTMEVVEHLLHFITAIGLHHTLPEIWGADNDSRAYRSMMEAAEKKYYDIDKYLDIEDLDAIKVAVMQEYVYWVITSVWNLQEKYGLGEDEWTLKNEEAVKTFLPSAYELYQGTIPKIMTVPSQADLNKY